MQQAARRVFAVGVLVLVAGVAGAHGGGVLDLGAIETRLEARAESPAVEPGLRGVYAGVLRILHRPAPKLLSRDLAKLEAVARSAAGPLAVDAALQGLIPGAVDAADLELTRLPDDVSVVAGRLASDADRARVEKAALAAYALHQQGRKRRRAMDERDAIGLFKRAAAGYENAIATADRLARRRPAGARGISRTLDVLARLSDPRRTPRDVANAVAPPSSGGGGTRPTTVPAKPGSVYTVAGTGEGGFNGDGREARRTSLYFVDEAKIGPDGLLYVLDWNNHMVRRIEADGTVTRICGSGVPGDSEGDPLQTALNHPSALAFDEAGRIYIAAWHNHKIKVWDPTLAGGPRVVTIAGTVQGNLGGGGLATDARFNLTPGILRLADGDLLLTDAANQVIHRIDLSNPQTDTNVAGVEVTTGVVTRFAGTTGVVGTAGDGGPAANCVLGFSRAQNAEPDGRMELDPTGRWLYVVSGVRNCIRRIDMQDPSFTITTFAGTGEAGYSGDGGLATHARLDGPSDIACAPGGGIFISDSNNHAIRHVAPDGTITTYAGGAGAGFAGDGGPISGARFDRPAGLELDASGNLFVCDRYNSRIRVLTSANPGALRVPIDPYALPLPPKGRPPEQGPSGTIDTYAGTGTLGFNGDGLPALDTDLYWPQDCAIDPATGLLWFCDWNNHRIRRVEHGGTVSTVIGSGHLGDTDGEGPEVRMNHPTDLTFHPLTGELWIGGWHTDKIVRLDGTTNDVVFMAGSVRSFTGDGGAPKAATFTMPSSVKFDAAGNWYVGDEGNRRIRYVDAARDVITTIAGNGEPTPYGDDVPALSVGLNLPRGQAAQPGGRVCLSPDGRWLYLAESSGHRVRRIDLADPQHTIRTIAGTGVAGFSGDGALATSAQLSNPTDVDCDAAGNVYVADQDNHAIRRIDVTTGTITTVVGDGAEGYTGDRGPAANARLRYPSGIHVDRGTGRLWIADTYNGVVRVVWE